LISESDILECFQRLVDSSYHKDSILLGSGDDAAVIDTQGKYLVHSVDISKIGVHFHESMRPEDIAYRSITTALSDLAGMGCFPSFISIALTSDIEEISWYERFSNGIKETLDEFSIDLVGGDVTKGELNVSVNVFGYPFQNPITRSGAKPNESIYITGQLGKAKQGLDDWLNKKSSIYCQSYLRPKPQFQKAKEISDFASSCIDISDGLIKDLRDICRQSNVGAELYFKDIPITNDDLDLTYGDDYELCFTAPSSLDDRLRDQGFFLIGKTTESYLQKYPYMQVFMKNGSTIDFKRKGWDPFS
tara:strand:+ start:123 stop:1034 length:912 start_codon:yes stop_codon:yes gene_type:complete